MALSVGRRVGPYEVLGVAGKGGMGEVYRARDTRLGRVVALKVLSADVAGDPDRRKRLEQEARVISSLSEPHICRLFDIGHDDGLDYLVMEFLEGETLQQRLLTGPLSRDQVLRHGREIAVALGKAHRIGIVHRDLKPGNIMLTKAGATLLDFGLARASRPMVAAASGREDRATETIRLTGEGAILGTWQYMAPEQIEGLDADARTDMFALGAVLYEMATGLPAFTGKTRASLVAAVMSFTPPPVSSQQRVPPSMGPAFDRVVQRCLEKDPDARWQSASDLATELEWIAATPAHDSGAADAARSPHGSRLAWGLAAVATAAALGTGFLLSRASGVPAAPVSRLSIVPPAETSFDSVVLSPDGTRLAFTVEGAKDHLGVWIRSLDSTAPQLVPDSAGAAGLFWSPDSRYLGFIEDLNVKRVDAAGGAPEVLCHLSFNPANPTAAWGRDGVVLISSDVYRPMQQLTLSDCSIKPLKELDALRKEIGQTHPVFLPDGRHFLWVSNRLLPDKGLDVYAGVVGSDDRTLLVHNASDPTFVAPGYLVFARGGKLLAQAFDAARLQLSNEPFSIVPERVRANQFAGATTYSFAGNGTLVYLPDAPVAYRLEWRRREGATLGPVAEPGLNRLIQLSPDGRSILVSRSAPDTGAGDIWIFDTLRTAWRRFGADRELFPEARWSPDGRSIVYMARHENQFGLYRAAVDRDETEVLLQTALWRAPRAFSPDAHFLLFENYESQTGFDLWSLPLAGDRTPTPFVQTRFNEGNATFSPNGAWVAYVSDKSGKDEIYVLAFPQGGREWKVSAGVAGRIGGGSDLAMTWRGDGKELFYTSDQGKEMAVGVNTVGEFNAGIPVPLFAVPSGAQVDVTPDGQRFLINAPVNAGSAAPLTIVEHWTLGQPAN
jgi:serine/threonine protein kinase/Tol biopolymer transport system component